MSSFTAMFNVTADDPPELVAVITKLAAAETDVGVPVISHVVALIPRPAGNVGEEEQLVMAPPVEVPVIAGIASSFVKTNTVGLKLITGGISVTLIEMIALELPPVLFAVIV